MSSHGNNRSNQNTCMNELIINYNDACIYQSDLDLLESDHAWLNDSCIHFQMKRYTNTIQRRNQFRTNHQTLHWNLCFFDPSIVSFFMYQLSYPLHQNVIHNDGNRELDDDDWEEKLELKRQWLDIDHGGPYSNHESMTSQMSHAFHNDLVPEYQNRQFRISFLFIPVNDSYASSVSTSDWKPTLIPRGNHWSLLFAIVITPLSVDPSLEGPLYFFFHIDSMCGINSKAAHLVAQRVHDILTTSPTHRHSCAFPSKAQSPISAINPTTSGYNHPSCHADSRLVHVIECRTPQQQNGYDCGLCTLGAVEAFATTVQDFLRLHLDMDLEQDNHLTKHLLNATIWKDWIENTLHEDINVRKGSVPSMAKSLRQRMVLDVYNLKAVIQNNSLK